MDQDGTSLALARSGFDFERQKKPGSAGPYFEIRNLKDVRPGGH
jgi:hypothetical protein